MKTMTEMRRLSQGVLLSALAAFVPASHGQTPFAWEHTKYFQYNIENVTVAPAAALGSWTVKVIFSASDPTSPTPFYWDIKTALPFQSPAASVTADFAWDGKEFTNAGSENAALAPIMTTALGSGAALPVQARGLLSPATGAKPCSSAAECPNILAFTGRYFVTRTITPAPFTTAVATGRVAIEGRPVCNGLLNCPPPGASRSPACRLPSGRRRSSTRRTFCGSKAGVVGSISYISPKESMCKRSPGRSSPLSWSMG